jgi:hypothetical protein
MSYSKKNTNSRLLSKLNYILRRTKAHTNLKVLTQRKKKHVIYGARERLMLGKSHSASSFSLSVNMFESVVIKKIFMASRQIKRTSYTRSFSHQCIETSLAFNIFLGVRKYLIYSYSGHKIEIEKRDCLGIFLIILIIFICLQYRVQQLNYFT